MSGSRLGGLKAAQKNLASNPNFYREIGAIGGKNGTTGGFGAHRRCEKPCGYASVLGDHKVSECAGARGGSISRRGRDA